MIGQLGILPPPSHYESEVSYMKKAPHLPPPPPQEWKEAHPTVCTVEGGEEEK